MFGKHRDHKDFHFGHFAHFAVGRHGGRHRFGRGGHGFFGRGGDEFPGARRLSSQDLQLVILALLADKPAHGYELIKIIEERSEGFYTPSPGVIYPALTYLEEVGHASVAQDGGRKLYSITAQGEAFLAEQRGTADAILQALSRIGRRMDEVREAFAGVSDLDADASDELHRARHNLKRALRSKHGSDSAEARRVAGILERAAAEILGK
ncbi:PadR family transcriptional regulator [Bradyrhizobium sp. BR13661]|jgi:DNA-binding PadR family transcriptional regulator|uniref:PadR family transcriptional regulator n=1 Tax=Bradyrhizobium sp. BR13661 TaxID=2940622 RepID=UPI002472F328|nr:PadR family transcriptional regulator [Bradyrhizobium sp. BR13661]MDH6258754.1 DNA-binding PadR family transcriptional regulator [Bradyrhizobium sp. BR13661]